MDYPIIVSVELIDRNDGGLDVRSGDLPGLIISGVDREKVRAAIVPAIRALLQHGGKNVGDIIPFGDDHEHFRQYEARAA